MLQPISLTGPLEKVGEKLMLRIPLSVGGSELALSARGIGTVEEEMLQIEIPPWLATKLRVGEGSLVTVDNLGGNLNISAADQRNAPKA